jgi:all-trans-retinol 13,14-reductase
MKTDVAIVGAGFGGLSAAILLARLGHKVTLIESAAQPGGCLRSYSRDGIDCPVGVHYFGSAAPGEWLGDFIDLLGIRNVLKMRRLGQSGVIDRFVFDDEVFDIPDTVDKFEAALGRRFAHAPDAVAFVMHVCRAAMTSLRTDTAHTSRPALPITRNALDVLTEKGLPERLMDILSLHGFLLGLDLSICPAAFLLIATASLLMSAWELGCTGSEMANALVHSALGAGANLIAGDGVAAVEVANHRASGVLLQSGSRIEADVVIAAIHPKIMLDLIPRPDLSESYREGVSNLRETTGMICAVALLDEKLHPAQDFNLFRVHGAPSRKVEGVYGQIRPSGRPGATRLIVLTESPYQDWTKWHDTQTGRRGFEYRAEKMRRAEAMLSDLATAMGPLHEPRIVDVWTPLTLRDWVAAPQGSAYGVKHSIRDGLDYLVLSRPPLDRLFLVGQSAMAPGLLGVSMGVLRVVSAIAGRQAVGELMATCRRHPRETSA